MAGEQRLCQGLGLAIPKAAFATFATASKRPQAHGGTSLSSVSHTDRHPKLSCCWTALGEVPSGAVRVSHWALTGGLERAQKQPRAAARTALLGARRCSSSATWWEAVPCTAESLLQLRDPTAPDPTAPARHHPEQSRTQGSLTVLVAGDWDVVDSAELEARSCQHLQLH